MPALRPGAREILRSERSVAMQVSRLARSSSLSKVSGNAESPKSGKRANPAAVYAAPDEASEEVAKSPTSPLIARDAARGEGATFASAD